MTFRLENPIGTGLIAAFLLCAVVPGAVRAEDTETPAAAPAPTVPAAAAPLPLPPRPLAARLPAAGGAAGRSGEVIRGQLRPQRHTVLAAGMAGRLISVSVEQGKRVEAGDELARFDCAALEAEQAIATARLAGADVKFKVNMRLAKMQNVSGLDLEVSRAELAASHAELKRVNVRLANCVVTAPFAGTVVEKNAQAFQYLAEGAALLRLMDTQALEIEAVVPSTWLPGLAAGAPFRIRLDETGTDVAAAIDRTTGEVDSVSQTVRLIGRLVDPPDGLMPGMSGVVTLPRQPASPAAAPNAP